MSGHKFSRRRFIEMSSFLTAAAAYFPATGSTEKPFSLGAEIPDKIRIQELLKQKDALKWVFAGDSITMGVKHTHGHQSFPEIFEERIRWELQRMRDIIINTGVSGNTTKNILDDFDWRITQFKPSVVSMMIGTNDCAGYELPVFEQNLVLLIAKIRQLNAVPILHTPNVIISEKSPGRKRLDQFVTVIQNVAEREKLILVDNWTYWQNTLKNHPEINVFRNWLNDPLHPNQIGHQEIARLMFKELSIFDAKEPSCGGQYYEGEH